MKLMQSYFNLKLAVKNKLLCLYKNVKFGTCIMIKKFHEKYSVWLIDLMAYQPFDLFNVKFCLYLSIYLSIYLSKRKTLKNYSYFLYKYLF